MNYNCGDPLINIAYKMCKKVFVSLSKINYAVLKGEPLSIFAYGELGRRSSCDIDILVLRKDLRKIENILIQNGFETHNNIREDRITMLSSSHQIAPYVKKGILYSPIVVLGHLTD